MWVFSIDHIAKVVEALSRKYHTRDPSELCKELGIRIRLKDLETELKAYYYCQSRIRNIVVNFRVSEIVRRILMAHELGHDQLHNKIALAKGFQEVGLFNMTIPTEYEANVFAAELLIDDVELLGLIKDENSSFFGMAKELYVPAGLLDFKFRILKRKGYSIEAPHIANGDFLKNDIDGCFDDEE